MRKILMSLLTIAVVGALISGGAIAYFSDIESTGDSPDSPNVLATGFLELDGIEDSFTVEDLKPCEVGYGSINITVNPDSNSGNGWVHIYDIVSSSEGLTGGEKVCDPGEEINDIQDWMTLDLRKWQGTDDTWIILPEEDIKLSCAECFWIPIGQLDSGVTYELEFSFHLQPETGDCYQSDTCWFDVEVMLTQLGAPGPAPQLPQGMGTVRLEDKSAPDWQPKWNNATYGVLNYWVEETTSGTFYGKLIAKGLNANTWYQVTLNSQPLDGDPTPTQMANAGLAASAAPGHWGATWEGGWYTGAAALQTSGGTGDEGVYNIVMDAVTDGSGNMTIMFNSEDFMSSGSYNDVKVIVKEYQLTGSPVTTGDAADADALETLIIASWGGGGVSMVGKIMEVAAISFTIP